MGRCSTGSRRRVLKICYLRNMDIPNIVLSHVALATGQHIDLRTKRAAICDACPYQLKKPFKHCALCGCGTAAKQSLPKNHCPKKKW